MFKSFHLIAHNLNYQFQLGLIDFRQYDCDFTLDIGLQAFAKLFRFHSQIQKLHHCSSPKFPPSNSFVMT